MNKPLRILLLFFLSLFSFSIEAQDSSKVLAFEDFLKMVVEQHPMSRQADIREEMGVAELLATKGVFDPKLFADINQKYFDNKQYYSLIDGGLKIPTWIGADFYAGFEQNGGDFLSQMDVTPPGGLAYAGVSVPLGQGLFMDRRRADLRSAQMFVEMTQNERVLMLNDLLLEASKVYWDWFTAYNNMQVYSEALELAEQRYEAVRQSVVLGDVPGIDTVEAGIQVQNRKLKLQESTLYFNNAQAWLQVYLWSEGWLPLELGDEVVPPGIKNFNFESFNPLAQDSIRMVVDQHPEIRRSELKIDQLNIERRLKIEMLKPVVNLKYNALSEPINNNPFTNYSINNYTWGLNFNMPLFLRKGRGGLELTKLKIEDETLALTTKRLALQQKIIMSFNTWQTTVQQIDLYTKTVQDYFTLLQGERSLFNTGESSLFMVNSRELGYINAQITLVKLYKENQMSAAKTLYEMGLLHQAN